MFLYDVYIYIYTHIYIHIYIYIYIHIHIHIHIHIVAWVYRGLLLSFSRASDFEMPRPWKFSLALKPRNLALTGSDVPHSMEPA